MNCKLEKFWNSVERFSKELLILMNCKLEKFWNLPFFHSFSVNALMNCKLEKFWNLCKLSKGIFNFYEL